MQKRTDERRQWSLLSSHGQVLTLIGQEPDATVSRLAGALNFSERRIMGVLRDLESAGMISRSRHGRHNRYAINLDAPLRTPLLRQHSVRALLSAFGVKPNRQRTRPGD